MTEQVIVSVTNGNRKGKIPGHRVTFSPYACFTFEDKPDEIRCLEALGQYLLEKSDIAIYGGGALLDALVRHVPALESHFVAIVTDSFSEAPDGDVSENVVVAGDLPSSVKSVFLCETAAAVRMQMATRLGGQVDIVEPDILAEIAPEVIPRHAWVAISKNIYPIDLPEISFERDLDLLLLDCPARNLALLPNGLAYVHNALKKADIRYQTFDLDVIAYHRFHVHRLYDVGGEVVLSNGKELPADPWQAEHYDLWADKDVIRYFMPIIEECAAAIIEAKPKILALSIQQCSERFSSELVHIVKAALPDTIILCGGFSCYSAEIGLRSFPQADYMCIGESELTIAPLVEMLAHGERPKDLPGVISQIDTPFRIFIPGPMPHDLDMIDAPRYEWFNLDIYRNFNGYQLIPVIASRGCRWSRCTFCAERFYWRIRTPKNFVDELEWLISQGCTLFMFNESDLNGMPEVVLDICDEIIRRKLNIKLTGQLRIHKKSDKAFFEKLAEAGFVALRFGVDAFSENTLRLQKKGYTTEMVSQNLKDCWEAGIYTEVNWVIGVPGETEDDITEGIELILKNREYIGRLANINPLILVNGGVYWIDPEAHNINFRVPKDELYDKFPRAIPADMWFSTEPYIDAQVRKERFERIVLSLHDAGFPVGAWAQRIIEDVKTNSDKNRAGAARDSVAIDDEERNAAAQKAAVAAHDEKCPDAEFCKELENHRIYKQGDAYYAVPKTRDDVTATSDLESMPGVIREMSEDSVMDAIDSTFDWANSRGQYDAQRQRRSGSHMKVNSVGSLERKTVLPEDAVLIRHRGEIIAIATDNLDSRSRQHTRHANDDQSLPPPTTLLRKAVRLLPQGLRDELRRLIRNKRSRDAKIQGAPSNDTDASLVWTVAKEFWATRVGRQNRITGVKRVETAIPGTDFNIQNVVTEGSVPDLMRVMGTYNIVQFDGRYYGTPQGLAVDWQAGDAEYLPGMIVSDSVKEIMAVVSDIVGPIQIESETGSPAEGGGSPLGPAGVVSDVPQHLKSIEGYNIVTYEGWIYGIPQSLGDISLTETDIMELPGVIRDVSIDVVENEILDQVRVSETVAAE